MLESNCPLLNLIIRAYLLHTIKIQSMPARLLIKRCRHVFGGSAVNVVPAAGFLFIATTPPSSDISLISHSLNNVYDQALVLWIYSLPWPTLTSPSSDDITPGRDQLTGLVDGGLFTLFELCVRMCDHMSKDDHDDGRRGTIQMLIYSKNKAIFIGISLSASQRRYQSKVTPPSNNNETDQRRWTALSTKGERNSTVNTLGSLLYTTTIKPRGAGKPR